MSGEPMMGGSMIADDKMSGSQMPSQKTGEMSGGDKTNVKIDVDVTINVIQWSMGGGSAMQNIASPSMMSGMTHQV